MEKLKAYDEIIDFIASGTNPGSVIAFKPSEAARIRVEELIQREKTVGLSKEEKAELDLYMQLEHLMRMAKARARKYVDA